MEQEKVFVLKNKKTFKRSLNIYVIDANGKQEKRNVLFSTERLVDAKLRATNARTVSAEYVAKNDAEVDALLTNSAYGITYVRKDDPEGKLKRPTRFISTEDAEKAALKNLFDAIGLDFNPALDVNVLKKQYEIQVHALAGVNKITEGSARSIPAEPVNVEKNIVDGIQSAKAKFEEKYGYPVPEIVANDLAFFDGLSNPDFNAEKYIAAKEESAADVESMIDSSEQVKEPTIEELQKKYFEKFGRNVANIKKNDAAWIKAELGKE